MSTRWPGGIISGTAPIPTGGGAQDTAPGVWTLEQADQYIATNEWPGTGIPDPQFQYVTALLHGDGTNTGQNNTFIDSSPNNFTITRNGNTTQGSFSPYGDLWSNFFDGSGDYLSVASNAAFGYGTGDFSLEFWAYPNTVSDNNRVIFHTDDAFNLELVGSGRLQFFQFPTAYTGGTYTANNWVHCCITRVGTIARMFVNGTLVNNFTFTATKGNSAVQIGANAGSSQWFNGYLSNVRIVKGGIPSAYSTSSTTNGTQVFTPQTTPFTGAEPLTGGSVSLLTCQSNRFRDASTNNFTITVNGNTSVQRFSPFQNLATYTTARVGGSGYFDGSGDSISVTNAALNPSGQDLTVSFWMYVVSYPSTFNMIFEVGTASANDVQCPVLNTGELRFQVGGIVGSQISGVKLNNWHYVTCVKSGNNFTVYLDNVAGNTVSLTASSQTQLRIGTDGSGGTPFNGYISNFRYIRGSAIVPTSIPTAPLPPITNTQFLCNFTNAAIFDSDASNDFETVGNAQISTSVVKYGTGSMYFDGTGDYLVSQINPTVNLGSGNFTVEGWFYFNAVGTNNYEMISKETLNAANNGFRVVLNSSQKVVVNMSSNGTSYSLTITGATTIAANTWYHVAISKVGTTVTSYINGNQDGSGTFSGSLYETNTFWALATRGGFGTALNGYIDDFRITTGYARYWYNFQPPTRAFPNYGGTLPAPTNDPLFAYNTLLLNGDGANGGQNNTFLDSSTNNFTITRNGNTTQGSFSPYGTLWSNFFDGTNDRLTIADNAALRPGTLNFTIEAWVYRAVAGAAHTIFAKGASTTGFVFGITSSNTLRFINTTTNIDSTLTIPSNTWTHVAVVREGTSTNQLKLYINGQQARVATVSTNFTQTNEIRIGENRVETEDFNGHISNLRYVVGSAVYTSEFTPPTAPLTAIANTQLLTCQSNRFVDNSTNNFTVTPVNNVSVQRFSPFEPSAPYSTSVIGGSGYFDGSGDWLDTPSNAALGFGTGDFTIEGWFYPNNTNRARMWSFSDDKDNLDFSLTNAGDISYYNGTTSTTSSGGVVKASAWNHVACVRSSGTVTVYVNGTSILTQATTPNTSTRTFSIAGSPNDRFNGYIANLRIVKGTAVYTANFTPPTAPLTAITNTQLLTNFINAAIPDLTMQNDLETVGNAQISTSVVKYGTGSLYFDGNGDWLAAQDFKASLANLQRDFTVEAWIYLTATGSFQGIVAFTDSTGWSGWQFAIGSSQSIYFEFLNSAGAVAGAYSSNNTIPTNIWTHVATARVGSTITIYVNGNPVATTDYAGFEPGPNSYIGVGTDRTKNTNWFNGYIDDLRITRGVSRYAQPFTPPTAALPTY